MRLLLILVFVFTCLSAEDYREVFMRDYDCDTHAFFLKTEYKEAALVVLFQAAFESNWGRAHWVQKRNQVFALKEKTGDLDTGKKPWEYIRYFDAFEDALTAQLAYYRKRGYPVTLPQFISALRKHRYAQNPAYADKVSCEFESMRKYVRRHCSDEAK